MFTFNLLSEGTCTHILIPINIVKHLRNEFNFWNVHGIMNTSGLVQSK